MANLTKTIKITRPVRSLKNNLVKVPGSKYLANRLLLIAGLAKGKSIISNIPQNRDIEIVRDAMEALGVKISTLSKADGSLRIEGTGGFIKTPKHTLFTGENGTFSRFAVALAALGRGTISLDSAPYMKERPMEEILSALSRLGVSIESNNNSFPLKVQGPLKGGEITLKGNTSSQYFSALLLTLPYAHYESASPIKEHFSTIYASTPLVSENYLTLTTELMEKFGIGVELIKNPKAKKSPFITIRIPTGQYLGRNYTIEPDPVSATYFMAIGALGGTKGDESIIIENFNQYSNQGEARFPEVLQMMGCRVEYINEEKIVGLKVSPPSNTASANDKPQLRALTVDMSNMPDAVQTLAILAANANGKTRINGIAHLRHKESNRIEDTANELKKCGIKVKTGKDFMEIEGGSPCPALLDGHNDHRMVMSLALLSLRTRELKIKGYEAVEKSFPLFFNKLANLGFELIY